MSIIPIKYFEAPPALSDNNTPAITTWYLSDTMAGNPPLALVRQRDVNYHEFIKIGPMQANAIIIEYI